MLNHQPIEIFMTSAQKRKYMNKEPFQLSHDQILDNVKARHMFHLGITPTATNKLIDSIKTGKGFRFNPSHIVHEIKGGSVKSFFKKAGKTMKNGINKGLHYVDHNALPFLAKNAGNIANELKNYIPPSVLSGVASGLVNSLATMSGNPELSLLLNPLVDKGINAAYAHDYNKKITKKDMRSIGRELTNVYQPLRDSVVSQAYNLPNGYNNAISNDVTSAYSGYSGNGLKLKSLIHPIQTAYTKGLSTVGGSIVAIDPGPGGKFRKGNGLVKGSNEARDHMAKIRSMRKKIVGGSFK